MKIDDEYYMNLAIREARFAASVGEVPIGAVIVKNGKVVSTGHNLREHTEIATQHAEIIAIEAACVAFHSWRLNECTLYVTVEPCLMCAGAILNSRIKRVVYGTNNKKGGTVNSLYKLLTDPRQNHQVEVLDGVKATQAAKIMQSFFKSKRKSSK